MSYCQISTCDACQPVNLKMVIEKSELHPVPVKSPWHQVAIGFVGPITPTSRQGNRYILTLSDYFSKYVEATLLPNKCASGAVDILCILLSSNCSTFYLLVLEFINTSFVQIFMRMGIPRVVTSDNGTEFKNELDKELMKLLEVKHIWTTPYHP